MNIMELKKREKNIPKVEIEFKLYQKYILAMSFSILLGVFCSLIVKVDKDNYNKNSIKYGIPFIRSYFFFFPLLLNFLFSAWLIFIYSSDLSIQSEYNKNIFKYIKRVKGGLMITNFIILMTFYLIFYQFFEVLHSKGIIRLSGHVLASMLSGAIVINVKYISDLFKAKVINTQLMNYFSFACLGLLLHNIYSIFWTAFIFHQRNESILALIISIVVLIIIPKLNFDKVIFNLFDFKIPVRKEKNMIYPKMMEK